MQSSQFHCNLLEVKSGAEENQSMELLFIISLYSEQAVSKAQSPLSAEHCSFWVFTFFLWERGMGELLNMENAQSVLGLREMRGVLTVQRDSHERRVLNFNYPRVCLQRLQVGTCRDLMNFKVQFHFWAVPEMQPGMGQVPQGVVQLLWPGHCSTSSTSHTHGVFSHIAPLQRGLGCPKSWCIFSVVKHRARTGFISSKKLTFYCCKIAKSCLNEFSFH